MADVVEVLEHWAAGRPLRAIAESLGLDRHTVRQYVTPAREAGLEPGAGPPPEGWAAFVARVCPQLGTARKNGAASAWDELAARHDEIAELLKVNRPSPVWQRMYDDDGLQASLPYAEQLRRWQAGRLDGVQRREIERRSGLVERWRNEVAAVLKLADELKDQTIEALMRKSDLELGIEALLGQKLGRRRPGQE